ncbi:anti-sigma factor [Symbioplanes lichenis]|uniref:anti-sigma factor n=1 Tax=Symbioplanes lichenis TaxID=1629072 RepID=UPI00273A46CC|nr:anti-sigma factor [Actinoplanes lichenis]
MTSDDVHSLVGAYVLDAVDDDERASFEQHVAGCASCRAELAELRETAGRMADSTWSIPPPRLRAEVMGAIRRTRQLPPADGGRPASEVVSLRPAARLRRWPVAAAAALILSAGTGAGVWAVQEHRLEEQSRIAAAAAQREARVQAILSASDVVMKSGAVRGGGTVTVASSASHSAAVVLMGAVTPPAKDRAFQLWAVHDTTMTDAGVLAAGAGSAVQIVEGLPGSDALGVTLEPAGGSAEPSLPPVAEISLT